MAFRLDKLAMLLFLRQRLPEAEALYRLSLALWEKAAGAYAPDVSTALDNLAVVLASERRYAEAEPLYRRSLSIREWATVQSMNNMALVLSALEKNRAAEAQFKVAVRLAEDIPRTLALPVTLENYAELLRKLNREAEAGRVAARARQLSKGR